VVAALMLPDESARYGFRQGLFALAQHVDGMLIRNVCGFQPVI
jgi:hypothetical protein